MRYLAREAEMEDEGGVNFHFLARSSQRDGEWDVASRWKEQVMNEDPQTSFLVKSDTITMACGSLEHPHKASVTKQSCVVG